MRPALAFVLALAAAPAAAGECRTDFAASLETVAVRDIQEQLAAHGYNPGPADGVPGPRTCAAVRAYQKDAGLAVDGVLDTKLQNHLRFQSRQPAPAKPRR